MHFAQRMAVGGSSIALAHYKVYLCEVCFPGLLPDRKSTRLNSSHLVISYAVFCLQKKALRLVLATAVMGEIVKGLCNPFRMSRIRSHSLIRVLLSELPVDEENNIRVRRDCFQHLSHPILDILRI